MKECTYTNIERKADQRVELILIAGEGDNAVAYLSRVAHVTVESDLALRNGPYEAKMYFWTGVTPTDGGDAAFIEIRDCLELLKALNEPLPGKAE